MNKSESHERVSASICGVLAGHNGMVTSLACASRVKDKKDILVSGSRDKTVMIWELVKKEDTYGVPKRSLTGHNHFIQDLALSCDGSYAITASWDNTLRLWDIEAGKSTAIFVGHTKDVTSVSLSFDNRQIISGSRDKSIKVWNIKGECKYALDEGGHDGWVSCTRISPGTETPLMMVSCGWDKVVKVWDITECKLSVNHFGHTGYINTVMISPDGSLCASGGKDGKVMLWDLADGTYLYSLDAGYDIYALAFNPVHYWLAVATTSGIRIWNLENKENILACLQPEFSQRAKAGNPYCVSLAWSNDGITLFSGYTDSVIRVWSVTTIDE